MNDVKNIADEYFKNGTSPIKSGKISGKTSKYADLKNNKTSKERKNKWIYSAK